MLEIHVIILPTMRLMLPAYVRPGRPIFSPLTIVGTISYDQEVFALAGDSPCSPLSFTTMFSHQPSSGCCWSRRCGRGPLFGDIVINRQFQDCRTTPRNFTLEFQIPALSDGTGTVLCRMMPFQRHRVRPTQIRTNSQNREIWSGWFRLTVEASFLLWVT